MIGISVLLKLGVKKSSERPRISDDAVEQMRQLFVKSLTKSTWRASSKLGVPCCDCLP